MEEVPQGGLGCSGVFVQHAKGEMWSVWKGRRGLAPPCAPSPSQTHTGHYLAAETKPC